MEIAADIYENQAIDRTHRIGQTKIVNIYRLFTIGTIEEKMQSLKQKKQQLFDALVDNSGDIFKKLTWEDIKELFATPHP
jgi:SNF2 family DNA or RNA helicase